MAFTESLLADQFVDAFTAATTLRVVQRQDHVRFKDEAGRHREVDLLLHLQAPEGQAFALVVEIKQQLYPRDLRVITELLDACRVHVASGGGPSTVLQLVAAEHLSEGMRQELRQAGIHYFDASGTLHFRHGTRLVDIERAPVARPDRRIGSIFTGAREQVVHAVLHHWHLHGGTAAASGNELAGLAQTSIYTVSKTMHEMERQDWVSTEGAGPAQRRRLERPAALLDAWADEWKRRAEARTRWYVHAAPGRLPRLLADGLAGRDGWAVTGAAAANLLTPHLTRADRATVMVQPGRAEEVAEGLRLERADEGYNVTLVERSGAAWLFADEAPNVEGLRLASPFVQYLDLLDGVGRNKELADELRQRHLKIKDSHGH